MRTNYLITSIAVFFLMFQSAEAQLLKKLKQRVEQKVENVIVEKASDKVAEKTSKTMDKAFEINLPAGEYNNRFSVTFKTIKIKSIVSKTKGKEGRSKNMN